MKDIEINHQPIELYKILKFESLVSSRRDGRPGFVPVPAPTLSELTQLVKRISQRVGRHLERRGLIVHDDENAWLDWDDEQASPLDDLAGHAITYRIAVGPHRGQKAFTLQTLPPWDPEVDEPGDLATAAGFSLHAGIAASRHQREKLERLCRYVTRPAVANSRLSLTGQGQVRYSLKTPWRDGTTHVLFETLDFIPQGTFSIAARSHLVARRGRLSQDRASTSLAIICREVMNAACARMRISGHGVFAPNSRWRAWITPARRGKRRTTDQHLTEPEKHRAMTWAQRLKRVFQIPQGTLS